MTPYLELFGFSVGLRRIRLNTSSISIHTNSLEIKMKVCASTFNSVFFVLLKRRFTPVTLYLELFGFLAGLRRIRLNMSSTSIHTNSLEIKMKVCASTFNSVFFVLLKRREETLKKRWLQS